MATRRLKPLFVVTGIASVVIIFFYMTSDPLEVNIQEATEDPGFAPDSLSQDDPLILDYIKKNGYLTVPYQGPDPYNLTKPNIDPSMGQSTVVKEILQNMSSGFFIECGALDGEIRSNTLSLERDFGWKGLLVEADPTNFKLLLRKRRRAWLAPVCLATVPHPHRVLFQMNFNQGKIAKNQRKTPSKNTVSVQCFPIYSLLAAMKVNTVDYFSLDVEGNEFEVLQTIPWEKVNIRVLSVEYIHDKASTGQIQEYMRSKGYRVITTVRNANNLANDLIFAHESVPFSGTIKPILT